MGGTARASASSLVGRIYDTVLEPQGWPGVLAELTRQASGMSAMLQVTGVAPAFHAFEYDPRRVPEYFARWQFANPHHDMFRRLPDGVVRAIGEPVFGRAFRASEYYNEWLRPQGFADRLGGHLYRGPRERLWFCIMRHERRGAFGAGDIARVQELAPHLGRAARLSSALAAERAWRRSVEAALNALHMAVMIVDAELRIIWMSLSAERLLAACDGLVTQHGRIACGRQADTNRLRAEIAIASDGRRGAPAASTLTVARAARRHLTAHVLPGGASWDALAPGACAVLLVHDPEDARLMAIDGFAAAYGLTAGESRCLQALLAGGGVAEAAARQGVSFATAKTHLQHVFEKTQTRKQAELVSLFLRSKLI